MTSAQTPFEPVKHHVHNSYIWLGSLRLIVVIGLAMFISFFSSIIGPLMEDSPPGEAHFAAFVLLVCALGFLLVAIIVIVYQCVSYRHLYYVLSSREIDFYQGIFNRKRVHIPYQRIQSVDQRATVVQRIVGVCNVSIDTAGGAANKAVLIPYVRKHDAELLRMQLFARKQQALLDSMSSIHANNAFRSGGGENILDAPAGIWDELGFLGGSTVDTGMVTYEYGLSNKELILTGLSNNTGFVLAVLAVAGILGQVAAVVFDVFPDAGNVVVGTIVETTRQSFAAPLFAMGILAFLGAALFIWLISALGVCLNYGGFHARRRDNRIEVEHGLLQHQFQGVEIDRIQSVLIRQGFIRRLIGYGEIIVGKVDAASGRSDENQTGESSSYGVVIHPFVKLNRVPEILAGMLPEFSGVPVDAYPVAPVALRRAVIRRCFIQGVGFWLAVLIAIAQVSLHQLIPVIMYENVEVALFYLDLASIVGYVICVVIFILETISAVLWFKGSSFAFNKRFMQVTNSGFSRQTISFPRRKIQYGYTKTNPFQRWAKTVTVSVRTAAGVGGTSIRLIDAQEDDADAWLRWLKPQRNVLE